MDGEVHGARETGEEQQGLQGDEAHVNEQPGAAGNAADRRRRLQASCEVTDVVTKADAEYRAVLADRDKKSTELERQIVKAANFMESAMSSPRRSKS